MEISYKPYFDPDFEYLFERIYPPRVCIDNDTYQDCTIVKVDSQNKQGILLEMVQVLTDLDLVISKSYICSDGGWFMDVFHVNDQLGNKITDRSLIHYIQEAMCASRRRMTEVVQTCISRDLRPRHVSTDHTALEMTGMDRPGLMSEISAVLAELGCHVSAAAAWTHNSRVALIVYVTDESQGRPITDPHRVAHIQAQLENVVEAHHCEGERRSMAVAPPVAAQTHTERRLHQLMTADRDYEECCRSSCKCGDGEVYGHGRWHEGTKITIETCKEKGYSIVTVRSKDRPKLLFDTVCTLTDMQYVVFHAAISSKGSIAFQEYYIRQKDGCTLNTDNERHRITRCLTAAIERRISHGLRLEVCTRNRLGLLSDVTRVLRENGLTIARAEIGTRGEKAVGSFYVNDVSGQSVSADTVEAVRKEIGGTIIVANNKSTVRSPRSSLSSISTSNNSSSSTSSRSSTSSIEDERPRLSLGSLLWSQLERLSGNFKPIKS